MRPYSLSQRDASARQPEAARHRHRDADCGAAQAANQRRKPQGELRASALRPLVQRLRHSPDASMRDPRPPARTGASARTAILTCAHKAAVRTGWGTGTLCDTHMAPVARNMRIFTAAMSLAVCVYTSPASPRLSHDGHAHRLHQRWHRWANHVTTSVGINVWTPHEVALASPFSNAVCSWHVPHKYAGAAEMCLAPPGTEGVSDKIRIQGAWPDCAVLPSMWFKFDDAQHIYIDLGANLGGCAIEMLYLTNASVLLFEPNPLNLFRLTSTLATLARSRPELKVKSRVWVVPVGVGDSTATLPLYMRAGNSGDSSIGAPSPNIHKKLVAKGKTQAPVQHSFSVHVRTLDQLFPQGMPTTAGVMKIDVQGFECAALNGGRRVLTGGAVRQMFFEVSPTDLEAKNCSEARLLRICSNSGFSCVKPCGGRRCGLMYDMQASWIGFGQGQLL